MKNLLFIPLFLVLLSCAEKKEAVATSGQPSQETLDVIAKANEQENASYNAAASEEKPAGESEPLTVITSNALSSSYSENVNQEQTPAKKIVTGQQDDSPQSASRTTNTTPKENKTTATPVDLEKKIIKTATVSIRVDKFEDMERNVRAIIKKYGGYLSSSKSENNSYNSYTETTLRVPASHFDPCLDELVALASIVENKTITAEDVTAEFVDIQARLKSKRLVEERYIEILKTARNVEEILRVENDLRVIREEIESKEGRLKYLSNQVILSTISLRYTRTNQEMPALPEETFFSRFFSGFKNGWEGVLGFMVVLANIWPVLVIGIAAAFVIRRKWNSKKDIAVKE